MKITKVKVTPISIPRGKVLTTSYGRRDTSDTVIVEVFTDDGIVGIGQTSVDAPYYGESMEGIVTNLEHYFVPAVIGEDPMNIEYLNAKFQSTLFGHLASQAAIEMALWDIKGKALGVPLYQLLGGRVRDGMNIMGFLPRDNTQSMIAEVEQLLAHVPYPVLKMKIGINREEDLAQYRAIREAVADRALIQVDGNKGYSISEAIPILSEIEAIGGLGAIEQPVAAVGDLRELARRVSVPVMVDESIYTIADAVEVVRRRAASMALMKITKHGGILTVQKIASVFEAAGLRLSVAGYFDLIAAAGAHLAAALPVIEWPSPVTPLQDTILTEPFVPDGIVLRPPEKPGLGVEFDPEKVEYYRVG